MRKLRFFEPESSENMLTPSSASAQDLFSPLKRKISGDFGVIERTNQKSNTFNVVTSSLLSLHSAFAEEINKTPSNKMNNSSTNLQPQAKGNSSPSVKMTRLKRQTLLNQREKQELMEKMRQMALNSKVYAIEKEINDEIKIRDMKQRNLVHESGLKDILNGIKIQNEQQRKRKSDLIGVEIKFEGKSYKNKKRRKLSYFFLTFT